MAKILGLPKLSPTMDEGTLVSWAKQEGDSVEVDDLLAEVETDKATMEFRSFDKGVLLKILVPEGETLAPDTPVAILGEKDEDIQALLEQAASGPGSAPSSATAPASDGPATPSPVNPGAPVGPAGTPAVAPSPEPTAGATSRVVASPLVRRMARERGIDLSRVGGSGPNGRVIKRDLESPGVPASPSLPAATSQPRVERVSQMRKTIARRLVQSKQEIPHYYLTVDVEVSALLQARKSINAELEPQGEKISINDLLIKASAAALRRCPNVNASFRGDTIVYHNRVDISVAVAVPDGLITPVVRGADLKGVRQIALEVRELARRAKDKRLQPEEFTDGTFSVSNLGMFGVDEFSAVINPPEGAILAVGTIRDEPGVRQGALVPTKRMKMTLSCDHRVIDGAVGAEFLSVLKRMLETPATILI